MSLRVLVLIACASVSLSCTPSNFVRQTPQTAQWMGLYSTFCPQTVVGSCRQCLDNFQCPGNQVCCPVSGLYCCVAMPVRSVKDRLFPQNAYGP